MTQKQWVQIQLVEGDHHTIVVGAVSSADTIRVIVRGSMGKLTRRGRPVSGRRRHGQPQVEAIRA